MNPMDFWRLCRWRKGRRDIDCVNVSLYVKPSKAWSTLYITVASAKRNKSVSANRSISWNGCLSKFSQRPTACRSIFCCQRGEGEEGVGVEVELSGCDRAGPCWEASLRCPGVASLRAPPSLYQILYVTSTELKVRLCKCIYKALSGTKYRLCFCFSSSCAAVFGFMRC